MRVRTFDSGATLTNLEYRLILYDTAGKSGGICAKVFDHLNTLIAQAADTIAACGCQDGCPSCKCSVSALSKSEI